jgi:hypothetical protein
VRTRIRRRAPLVAFRTAAEKAYAVMDLTAGYAPRVTQARRGLALLERRRVLIQDEILAPRPVEVVWRLHTKANVEAAGNRATLTLGKAKLEVRLLWPEDGRFVVAPASTPAPQAQQPDVRALVVHLPAQAGEVCLSVLLTPGGGDDAAPKLEPLTAWIAAGR